MEDPRFAEIDDLLTESPLDDGRLYDLITSIGSDPDGPRSLIQRYRRSKEPLVLANLAMMLSHAAWNPTPDKDLEGPLIDLLGVVSGTSHLGTRVTTLNVLKGLRVSGALRVTEPHRQEQLAAFLVECVVHPEIIVRAAVLDALVHLWLDGTLVRVLPGTTADPLRRALRQLAAQGDEDDVESDLEDLKDFWDPK